MRSKTLSKKMRRCSLVLIDKRNSNSPKYLGKIKPTVDSVFAFEDTLKAYDRIMSERARGKVVIRIDPLAE